MSKAQPTGKYVEYRVKEIKRYIVTRHEREVHENGSESGGVASQLTGEYPNWDTAYAVAYALCKEEHGRLGYDPCDMRIQYPVFAPNGTSLDLDPAFHSEDEINAIGRKCFVNAEGDIEAA